MSSCGEKAVVQAAHRPIAVLSQLCLAQRPLKPAQAVGLYVSLPMSTVKRLTGHDRLLTLQSCRLPCKDG